MRTSFLLMAFLAIPPALAGQEPGQRAAIPPDEAQSQAMKLAREVYGDQFAAAKTSDQKQKLAERLLSDAEGSKSDPAAHYVLLKLARDIAVLGGAVKPAFQAIETTAAAYQVDPVALKVEATVKAAAGASAADQHAAVVEAAIELADAAYARDDLDSASRMSVVAAVSSRKAGDEALAKRVVALGRRVAEAQAEFARLQGAFEVLKSRPTDPEASLAVGKYHCLVKRDWDTGLPLLALGSDAALQQLAQDDLAVPTSTEAIVKLADGWWDKDAAASSPLKARAAYWYRQALPGLTGLARLRVEKRLNEIAQLESGPAKTTSKAPATPRRPAAANDGWVDLIGGRTLRGWSADRNPQFWSLERGILVARNKPKQQSHLYYEKVLADFELEGEVKVNAAGNSGVYFRASESPGSPNGYEMQIVGSELPSGSTGSLLRIVPVHRRLTVPGEWFKFRVIAKGNHIEISINGEVVVDYVDPDNKYPRGRIALQCWSEPTEAAFRNLRVKSLDGSP